VVLAQRRQVIAPTRSKDNRISTKATKFARPPARPIPKRKATCERELGSDFYATQSLPGIEDWPIIDVLFLFKQPVRP
jgi:hypothetical protein